MDKAKLTFRINGHRAERKVVEIVDSTGRKEASVTPTDAAGAGAESQNTSFDAARSRSRQILDDWIHEEDRFSESSTPFQTAYYTESAYYNDPYLAKRSRRGWRRFPIIRLFSSIGGAVAVGVALGVIMLTIFSSDNGFFQGTTMSGNSAVMNPVQPPLAGDANDQNRKNVIVPLSEQPMFAVQAGTFSEKTSATQFLSQLKNQGIAGGSIFPLDGTFRIFIGAAGTKENAQQVAALLKAKGMDVYVKDLSIPGTSTVSIQEGTDAGSVQGFYEKAATVFDKLSAISASELTANQAVKTDETASIEAAMKQLETEVPTVKKSLSANAQTSADQMVLHLKEALTAQKTYAQSPGQASAWMVQMHLSEYLTSVNQWILDGAM